MSSGQRCAQVHACGYPDEDGRPPRLRELAVVGHRACPHRRAPQGDACRSVGAGAPQVQTPGDGGLRTGGPSLRLRRRGGRERDPGEQRRGRRAKLCDIPQATGQSVCLSARSPDLYMTRLLNMDAEMMVICQQASQSLCGSDVIAACRGPVD